MIDRDSLDVFSNILLKYVRNIRDDYRDRLINCTFMSGAKLNIYDDRFILTTKDGIAHEFEYSGRLSVALEVQDDDVFITVYDCLEDNIYVNVFNVMIYERYP